MMHIKSLVSAMAYKGICLYAYTGIALLFPFVLHAQMDSADIVYEQTSPAEWEKVEASDGLPEEAAPKEKDASRNDGEEEAPLKTDFYDTEDYYPEDYLVPPAVRTNKLQHQPEKDIVKAGTDAEAKGVGINSLKNIPYWGAMVSGGCLLILLMFLFRHLLFQTGNPALSDIKAMGQILGALHLNKHTSVYYVAVAQKVLIIGVSANTIALIESFPADKFQGSELDENGKGPSSKAYEPFGDTELAALRRDIQGLQRSIEEMRNVHLQEG